MTRHGGGGFAGGGGGGGGAFGGHGRYGGGSFGPPSHHHPPPPPSSFHPPHHHRRPPPPIFPVSYYGPPAVFYSSVPRGGEVGYQMPPPEVVVRVDRRAQLLNQTKGLFTFILVALLIGTVWLYYGPYGSTVIEIGVHDSRLLTARPFFVESMKFKNRMATDGPTLYVFDHKPPLNQESSWLDSQQATFSNGHMEFYYWMNRGSTVTVDYSLDVHKKLESVYLAMIRNNPEDLEAYYEKPNAVSKPLYGHDVLTYEVSADGDYAFSLVTFSPEDITVDLDFHFHTREYSTANAIQRGSLKTDSKINLSVFRSRYGLLQGPGLDKVADVAHYHEFEMIPFDLVNSCLQGPVYWIGGNVDIWEIELSYGIRWTAIVLIYGLVALAYLVTKSIIMASVREMDPSLPEYAPLVPPQETETTVSAPAPAAPSAPILSDYLREDGSTDLKDKDTEKGISEDKLCSVCLDAPKDSFFVPCGHRATCYACGLRISKLDPANCPICRQPIGEVKRIYDA